MWARLCAYVCAIIRAFVCECLDADTAVQQQQHPVGAAGATSRQKNEITIG